MKNLNLLTHIILTFISAFLIITIISGYLIFNEGSEKIKHIKKEEIASELNYMSNILDVMEKQKENDLQYAFKTARRIFENNINNLALDTGKKKNIEAKNKLNRNTEDINLPMLLANGKQLHSNYDLVDKIHSLTGANVAILQRFQKGFIKISTSISDSGMSKTTCTYIPNNSDVARKLLNGKHYKGKTYIAGQRFMSIYKPIKINGKIKAALFIGEPAQNIKKLKNQLFDRKIFRMGCPIIISANEKSKGKFLMNERFEGEDWSSASKARKSELYSKLTKENTDISRIDFFKEDKELYYTFYEPQQFYIGVTLPKDYLFTGLRSNMINILIFSFVIAIVISVLIVYFSMRQYSAKLGKTINSIDSLSKGELPSTTEDTNNPELKKLNNYVNKLSENIKAKTTFAKKLGEGNLEAECCYDDDHENDILGQSLLRLRDNLLQSRREQDRINWLQNATVNILQVLRKENDLYKAADKFLIALSEVLNIELGAVYLLEESTGKLFLAGTYGFIPKPEGESEFNLGEGIVGQAGKDHKVKIIDNISPDYVQVKFSAGSQTSKKVIAIPFTYNEKLVGVVELGTLVENIPEIRFKLIHHISESVAITFQNIQTNKAREKLLEETNNQKEELEKQAKQLEKNHEELKQTNEELQSQTQALEESEANLETRKEELRVANEKLEDNLKELQRQKAEVNEKNITLQNTRDELKRKTTELEKANRFKSEFLTNMSHELRTPLNSLLILAQTMNEDPEGNLNKEQKETIEIIYNSGKDLLNLINDILDLSKIEAGKMDIDLQETEISDTINNMKSSFSPSTKQKNIDFNVTVEKDTPQQVYTDKQRMEQIIRNLLSNAIKFTTQGSVTLRFFSPEKHEGPQPEKMDAGGTLGISVIDTGIGIEDEKKDAIFEAFQQIDGSISRQFGGTGLGLSISKELSHLLGGEITLQSTYGEGTTFNLFLPLEEKYRLEEKKQLRDKKESNNQSTNTGKSNNQNTTEKSNITSSNTGNHNNKESIIINEPEVADIEDDRNSITEEDNVLEIIEDDINFAKTLMDLAKNKDFKVIATNTGEEGIRLCKQYKPDALVLALKLPGIDGHEVLDHIKADIEIRHIPVHIVSGTDEDISLYQKGALGFLKKPLQKEDFNQVLDSIEEFLHKKVKKLLIIEDDPNQSKAIKNLLKSTKTKIHECSSGQKAFDIIRKETFDSIVLDLEMNDISSFELLDKLEAEEIALSPVIIYTGKELSKEETEQLQKHAQSIIIKGVKSEERLLDETSLFLHSMIKEFPKNKQETLQRLNQSQNIFKDKKILFVDDDIRNLFVLNRVLEERGFQTQKAQNGQKAIDILKEKEEKFDLILMDIIMPVMDGYEATEKIKNDPGLKDIPVIALTAKSMKGDREKSINAGVDDYLTKPVEINKLMNTIKIWLQNQ